VNYYNDNERFVAQWLRNLIEAGHIGNGVVDERSIADLKPDELNQYTRAHFFAGIAGWELALNLAGWPTSEPVWTGSCPCQPFSAAGKGKGSADDRNLWHIWFELIRVCRPPAIFGEQVAAAIRFGWLDRVFDDLEAIGYKTWACVLPACSIGAPHIRSRLFWGAGLADSYESGNRGRWSPSGKQPICDFDYAKRKWLANANPTDRRENEQEREQERRIASGWTGESSGMADSTRGRCEQRDEGNGPIPELNKSEPDGRLDNPASSRTGCGDATIEGGNGQENGLFRTNGGMGNASGKGSQRYERSSDMELHRGEGTQRSITKAGLWSDSQWINCRDGKQRRIPCAESGIRPLAPRLPGRLGQLRAYGNAIVPQVAAEFIKAVMEEIA
jgi:DNA (cytosine-5)-methyltransferase 1